jgi:hypothetical protein
MAELDADALNDVKKAIEYQNQRGHGADHAVPDHPAERQAIECDVAEEFANAYARQYGKQITGIHSNDSDPPDCFAREDGKQLGIEITELVKHKIRADNVAEWREARRRAGRELAPEEELEQHQKNYTRNYECSLWTEEEFRERLQDVITKKDGNEGLADCAKTMRVVLVIYTDDQNLPKADLEEWLAGAGFSAKSLKEVFLRGPHEAGDNAQVRPNPNDPSAWEKAAWVTPGYPLFRLRVS